MDTAGKIQVEIPVVVTPDGQVNSSYWVDADGQDHTDDALLYEHFPIEQPVKMVRVKAEIDLDKVFEGHEVAGKVKADSTE